MIHVSRLVALAATTAVLSLPAAATPVAGFATGFWGGPSQPRTAPLQPSGCGDKDRGEGGGSEGGSFFEACYEGAGSNRDEPGPGDTDVVVASVERGIEHCSAYSPVWRVDCLSNELERMAAKMPRGDVYDGAKSEILATAAKLNALAEQNADPAKPSIRRAAEVDGKRRTTTRRIAAVAPDRVDAVNAAADTAISELSTTLLRSAGNSPTTSREFVRVAQAVNSTKVLLRST